METNNIVSKVLVHEVCSEAEGILKNFCQEQHLVGMKDPSCSIMDILHSHTDLGAAFLCEGVDKNGESGLDLGRKIKAMRPELPLFLRRDDLSQPLAGEYDGVFAGSYVIDDMNSLKSLIDSHLFSTYYPIPLIRGIQELSNEAFHTTIRNMKVECEAPYMVKDQVIYGELFSLIPLESHWCRGFMMLQTTEKEIMSMIANGNTSLCNESPSFRDVNHILNEITNMVWGGIKSRFFVNDGTAVPDEIGNKIHVPILVNHERKFISFGTTEPHLCFRYTIKSENDDSPPIEIYQKLIFNLNWQPELFKEAEQAVDDMVDAGELEFF